MESYFDKLWEKGWKMIAENGGEVYGSLFKWGIHQQNSEGGSIRDIHLADEAGAEELKWMIKED